MGRELLDSFLLLFRGKHQLRKEVHSMVSRNTKFVHYKGDRYVFLSIVHPRSEMPRIEDGRFIQRVFHTEQEEYDSIVQFLNSPIQFSLNNDEYLVLYRREDDIDERNLYVRPISMFFEHVGWNEAGGIKRFTEVE